jgi:hypothetical protein
VHVCVGIHVHVCVGIRVHVCVCMYVSRPRQRSLFSIIKKRKFEIRGGFADGIRGAFVNFYRTWLKEVI